MKSIINIVLLLVVVGLAVFLGYQIYEPIHFEEEWEQREKKIALQLIQIRSAQQAHKGIKGYYAGSFDSLRHVLSTDSFKITSVFGDADEEGTVVKKVTYFVNAADSMVNAGIDLATLDNVPVTDANPNAKFKVQSGVVTKQGVEVPVVEVSIPVKDFMGEFAQNRYKRYNSQFEPNGLLKFGDLSNPSVAGTWRKFGKEKEE